MVEDGRCNIWHSRQGGSVLSNKWTYISVTCIWLDKEIFGQRHEVILIAFKVLNIFLKIFPGGPSRLHTRVSNSFLFKNIVGMLNFIQKNIWDYKFPRCLDIPNKQSCLKILKWSWERKRDYLGNIILKHFPKYSIYTMSVSHIAWMRKTSNNSD